jgi:predicted HAD superfamily Cof-like phosphohydrolase
MELEREYAALSDTYSDVRQRRVLERERERRTLAEDRTIETAVGMGVEELLAHNTELVERNRAVSIRTNVEQFHRVMGLPILDRPQVPPDDRVRLRLRLITEEFFELLEATIPTWASEPWLLVDVRQKIAKLLTMGEVKVDLPEFADALCDLDYVIEGTRLEFGIDGTPVLAEVQRANLAKAGGPVRDIEGVLRAQGWSGA